MALATLMTLTTIFTLVGVLMAVISIAFFATSVDTRSEFLESLVLLFGGLLLITVGITVFDASRKEVKNLQEQVKHYEKHVPIEKHYKYVKLMEEVSQTEIK